MLKCIILFFLRTYALAEVNIKHNTNLTAITERKKDTLHLYFPLKETGKDSTGNANALDTFTDV